MDVQLQLAFRIFIIQEYATTRTMMQLDELLIECF